MNDSTGVTKKANIVEPYLRLQNKATTWSSKSESDLTSLGRGEDEEVEGEKLGFNSSVPSTSETGDLPIGIHSQSALYRARKTRREAIDRFRINSEAPHCCVQGASKRRNSSISFFESYKVGSDNQDYTVMKGRARIKSTENLSVDICNGYAVPFPVVPANSNKKRSLSVVEYGNITSVADVMPTDRKISVSSEPANICQCIGKQKFIEGHYKATYVCDVKTGRGNEDISSPERTPQKVDSDTKTKPNLQSPSSSASSQNIDDTIEKSPMQNSENEAGMNDERNKKYDSLPIPSARKTIPIHPRISLAIIIVKTRS